MGNHLLIKGAHTNINNLVVSIGLAMGFGGLIFYP